MRRIVGSTYDLFVRRDGIIQQVGDKSWHQVLNKTHSSTFGRITQLLGSSELNDDFWAELEAVLLQADVGMATTQSLIENLHATIQKNGFTKGAQVHAALVDDLLTHLAPASLPMAKVSPSVTMLVGVNGSGKTTSAAKLAHWGAGQGQTVLLAAADTYRAAAAEQLTFWGEQLGIPVITGKPGSDPGAVVHDACQSALAKQVDHVIVDTSGRMHTEHNLMQELKKLRRVSENVIAGAPHAALLVLDAATGQNGLSQAKSFTDAIALDGVLLAKLDGSAKGGIAVAIGDTLDLPVIFVGTGEGLKDLEPLDPLAYVHGLLGIL